MIMTKGHLHTLKLMHIEVDDYPDEAYSLFFNEIDNGIIPPDRYFPREWDGSWPRVAPKTFDYLAYVELRRRFAWLGMRESEWEEGFRTGILSPYDFEFGCLECFETAKKIDTRLNGFERQIWSIVQGC